MGLGFSSGAPRNTDYVPCGPFGRLGAQLEQVRQNDGKSLEDALTRLPTTEPQRRSFRTCEQRTANALIAAGFAIEIIPALAPPKPAELRPDLWLPDCRLHAASDVRDVQAHGVFCGRAKREVIAEQFIEFLCVHFQGAQVPDTVLMQYADAWRFQTFVAPGRPWRAIRKHSRPRAALPRR
jgi:hypothetical protein